MLSRRDLVGKIAASGAVLLAAGAASASLAPVSTGTDTEAGSGGVASTTPGQGKGDRPTVVDAGVPATATAAAPWELLRPLTMGSVVAHGWKVAGLSGAVDGSCVLTLQNER